MLQIIKGTICSYLKFCPVKRQLQKWYFAFNDLACIQGVTFLLNCCVPGYYSRMLANGKRVGGKSVLLVDMARVYGNQKRICLWASLY